MRLKLLIIASSVLVAAGFWQVGAGQEPPAGPKQKGGPDPAELRQHGAYLVNAVTHCGTCHTQHDDKGTADLSRQLRGAVLPIRPKKETKNWADQSPDISGQGLAAKWGEAGMVKFLMTGIDPEGKKARSPMPAFHLNEMDARAVYLYLRSIPGVQDKIEPKKDQVP